MFLPKLEFAWHFKHTFSFSDTSCQNNQTDWRSIFFHFLPPILLIWTQSQLLYVNQSVFSSLTLTHSLSFTHSLTLIHSLTHSLTTRSLAYLNIFELFTRSIKSAHSQAADNISWTCKYVQERIWLTIASWIIYDFQICLLLLSLTFGNRSCFCLALHISLFFSYFLTLLHVSSSFLFPSSCCLCLSVCIARDTRETY